MTRTFYLVLARLSRSWKRWIIILFLFSNACQSVDLSSPSPTIQSILTEIPNGEILPTASSLPIATIQPISTKSISALSLHGPWFVYHPSAHYSEQMNDELVILNQDGTGRTENKVPACRSDKYFSIEEDSSNYIAVLSGKIYLLQPLKAISKIIHNPIWSSCHSAFTGNSENGLLADIYRASDKAVPELLIYEMPNGKIRDRFPIYNCSNANQNCHFDDVQWWQMNWSPNGRYLAFPAELEGESSDLYVYDADSSNIRQLTNGPDWVGQTWWSPDGKWIIMEEKNRYDTSPGASSLWAVSVSSNEVRLLYSLDDFHYSPQSILGWLDDERFLVYDGDINNALDNGGNLRLVDMGSGKVTELFEGKFYTAELDRDDETVAVYAIDDPNHYAQGMYLVSIKNSSVLSIGGRFQPKWNEDIGLFVTDVPCEDTIGFQAFDYKGQPHCAPPQLPPDNYPSPDGQAKISLKDGLWLESNARHAVQISSDTATQVVWCPDSGCFYFVAKQILYHVSLSDLVVQVVDERLGEDEIMYQWVPNKIQN